MTTWATPKVDWVTGDLVAASNLNDIGNDLTLLKSPATDMVDVNEASNYTTTSTTFVDVDSSGDPDLSLTITTTGGDVMIGFAGSIGCNAGPCLLDVLVDATRLGGDDGIMNIAALSSAPPHAASFVVLKRGLSAGSHTFKLQWRTIAAATLTMYAGAGTTDKDNHPQFWVREVS